MLHDKNLKRTSKVQPQTGSISADGLNRFTLNLHVSIEQLLSNEKIEYIHSLFFSAEITQYQDLNIMKSRLSVWLVYVANLIVLYHTDKTLRKI